MPFYSFVKFHAIMVYIIFDLKISMPINFIEVRFVLTYTGVYNQNNITPVHHCERLWSGK